MKTIGILGGTSWVSTMQPYEWLNREAARRCGGHHSARIILYSIDYDPIKSLYHHGWDKIPQLLRREFEFMRGLKPDCLFMACNTLHKAYDEVADDLNLPFPFFHAVHLTRDALGRMGKRKILFLGTAFTMEDGFFRDVLAQAGFDIVIPEVEERAAIQRELSALSKGSNDPSHRRYFQGLVDKYERDGCEAVVLACTELPLAIDSQSTSLPIINPLQLQCQAALDFVLE